MLVQGKEKDPSALQCQTDHKENSFNPSIPQSTENAKHNPITSDRFRLFLEAVLVLLNAGQIAR